MEQSLPLADQAREALGQVLTLAQEWLLSPAAWSQFGLLIGAYLLVSTAGSALVR